jgi:hypothetical protein
LVDQSDGLSVPLARLVVNERADQQFVMVHRTIRSHIWSVVTISISAEALAAIEATLPEGREAERRPDGKDGYFITLPHNVLDRLKATRSPGESYSDVILRLARG